MKRLTFVLIILLSSGLSLPPLTVDASMIKIGIISQPSLFFLDHAGLLGGFYVDLLDDFKQRENLKMSYEVIHPDEIGTKLLSNELEMVIGLEHTPELARLLDFSTQSLNAVWGVLYVHATQGVPVYSIFDLHQRTIAVKRNDPHAIGLKKMCTQFKINCLFRSVDSYSQVVNAVLNLEVDAGVTNNIQREVNTNQLWRSPFIFDITELKAAILKGKDPHLLEKLDHYLNTLYQHPSEIYAQLQTRWLSAGWGTSTFHVHPSEIKRELKQWLPQVSLIVTLSIVSFTLLVYFFTTIKFKRQLAQLIHEKNRLQADENKYRNLVENVPYGFEELSLDGTILFANTAAHHIRRYNAGELLGKSILDMTANNEQKKQLSDFLNTLANQPPDRLSSQTCQILRKDGNIAEIRVEWHYKRDVQGQPIGLFTAITDITGLRETKDKIKNYHSDLKKTADERAEELKQVYNDLLITAAVFENTAEGIFVIGLDGLIQTVNPAFCKITGYTKEHILQQPLNLLTSQKQHPDFFAKIRHHLEQKGSWQGEVINRRQSGQAYPAWLSLNVVHNAHGVATQYVALLSDITKRKQIEYQVWKQANFDALTQLPNRHLFHQRLAQAISHATKHNTLAALMFIDLDHFKQVNDTLGHDAGDELLIQVTQRLSASVRKKDTVARMGGDEFTVILPEIEVPEVAKKIAQQILAGLNQSFQLKLGEVHISGSIGIVIYPHDGEDITTLLKKADIAMYKIKEQGRNGFYFYTDLSQHD